MVEISVWQTQNLQRLRNILLQTNDNLLKNTSTVDNFACFSLFLKSFFWKALQATIFFLRHYINRVSLSNFRQKYGKSTLLFFKWKNKIRKSEFFLILFIEEIYHWISHDIILRIHYVYTTVGAYSVTFWSSRQFCRNTDRVKLTLAPATMETKQDLWLRIVELYIETFCIKYVFMRLSKLWNRRVNLQVHYPPRNAWFNEKELEIFQPRTSTSKFFRVN